MSDSGPSASRRAFLAGVAASGLGAGCLGGAAGGEAVSVLAAGSLQNALESGLAPQVEPTVQVEARGSVELARQVAAGQKDPDIVAVADDGLFGSTLDAPWHAVFATNAIVLVYNPETEGGRRVEAAASDEWYRPLVDGDVTLGRTDPDLDPLGYRTLFALELAADHYGTATDLRAAVAGPDQTYPETQLVSQLETGSVDAAFVYRNMAVERDYASVDLPAATDLSDPARADAYATATYELPDGTTVEGDVIRYAATARRESEAVRDVFESCVAGDYLASYGFARPEGYPRFTDDAPDGVAN